ncbi:MAG: hypothetical protein ACP5XB_05860 [Isosphaeraceae bacterium]
MHAALALLIVALVGVDETPGMTARPAAVATRPAAAPKKDGPVVAFEVRDIRAGSLDWRGQFMTRLHPVARQEGVAAWTLDLASFGELLQFLQSDERNDVLQAPRMTAHVGAPARMTSEQEVNYVAALKRVADGAPNQSTRLAFEPQVDKIHHGVRVHIVSSRLKGQSLEARVFIEENRLVALHTVTYHEGVKPKADPEVAQASFLARLNPNHAPHPAALNATIQVPEVDSRHIEGQWLIPSDGVLLVSLGPRGGHDKGLIKKSVEEHLIAITARLVSGTSNSSAPPAAPAASTRRPR